MLRIQTLNREKEIKSILGKKFVFKENPQDDVKKDQKMITMQRPQEH